MLFLARLPVLLLLVACGAGGDNVGSWQGSLPVAGRVYLGRDFADTAGGMSEGEACEGTGGYDTIKHGATISVIDDSGKTVATARLEAGTIANMPDAGAVSGESPSDALGCVFDFAIAEVPGDGTGYRASLEDQDLAVEVTAENRTQVHLDFP